MNTDNSLANVRVGVAKEVLSLLDVEHKITATPSSYFGTSFFNPEAKTIAEAFKQEKNSCQVCAVGAMVLATYRLHLTDISIGYRSNLRCGTGVWNSESNHVSDFFRILYGLGFDPDEIYEIEVRFENWDNYTSSQQDPSQALRSIMQNIIDHGGSFVSDASGNKISTENEKFWTRLNVL